MLGEYDKPILFDPNVKTMYCFSCLYKQSAHMKIVPKGNVFTFGRKYFSAYLFTTWLIALVFGVLFSALVFAQSSRAPILLNAQTLQTEGLAEVSLNVAGKQLQLVQFSGPIKPEWVAQLNASGLRIVNYLPDYSYLVWGDSAARAALAQRSQQGGTDGLLWTGAWRDEYKLAPSASARLLAAQAEKEPQPERFSVQLVADSEANAVTLDRLLGMGGRITAQPGALPGFVNLVIALLPEQLANFAKQPDIISIHHYIEPELLDERQNMIVAGNVTGNNPNPGNYFDLLTTWGFTQAQFNASGFLVDVTDDGADVNPSGGILDNAMSGPVAANHFVLFEGGNRPIGLAVPTGTSRFVLKGRFASAGTDLGLGNSGHGQLNMSIVGGYVPTGTLGGVDFSVAPHADASGFRYGLGVAPFVRMANSVIFDPDFRSPVYPTMLNANYAGGTRISSNSWGSPAAGAYTTNSQTYDGLVRDAQSSVALNQQMSVVFAAGNSGPGVDTIGAPGTAKNVITVGASENVHPFGGNDGCVTGDTGADSLNDMIAFSSRGPTDDLRVKPDIVGPGTHVTGMAFIQPTSSGNATEVATFRGDGVCGGVGQIWFPSGGQRWYTASSGTSHSAPALAGGAALVYQQFINNPSYLATQRTPASGPPSPALVKAYLMNTARYLTGTGANDQLPSNNQGAGLMDLGRSFDSVPRFIRDQVTSERFTASGQSRSYVGTIAQGASPVRITLAWTDAPGATAGNAFVNNLDLTVFAGGNLYRGNVFAATGGLSTTGGSADVRNNVESVFLPAGTTGPVSILVNGTNIAGIADPTVAGNNQDFSLVSYNLSNGRVCPAVSLLQPTLPDGTVGTPYSQTLTGVGGSAPYTYSLVGGALPPGITLSGAGLSGTPTTNGIYNFTIQALDANGCSGTRAYTIGVGAPVIALGARTITTGNNALEPNECNALSITLNNTGNSTARNVIATLSSSDPDITVNQAVASYPDIAIGGSAVNLTPFRISSSAALVCLSNPNLTLTVSFTGGGPAPLAFSLPVGTSSPSYVFTSSPSFISLTGTLQAGSQADDAVVDVTVPAGFNFSVYGSTISGGTVLRAGTNGFLLLTPAGPVDGANAANGNTALPTTNLNDTVRALMPFWDDLDLRTSAFASGGIYSSLLGTAPNRTWQLIWRGQRFDDTGTTETLRVAIEFREGQNSFGYLYDLTGATSVNGASATVGIQASFTGLFTQHSFNSAVITPGLRLNATNPAPVCTAGAGVCGASSTTITSITPAGAQLVGVPYAVNVSVSGNTPTGTVAVSDPGGGSCTIILPASSCMLTSLTPSVLPAPGFNVISARYSGDNNNPAASDTENVVVNRNTRGLEVGSLSIPATIAGGNALTRVSFARAFNATPVVVVMPSNEDADPQAVRIRNVSSTGFDVLQVEAPGCLGCTALGSSMSIHWLAAMPGVYRLPNDVLAANGAVRGTGTGVLIRAGTVSTSSEMYNAAAGFTGWPSSTVTPVSFPAQTGFNFGAPPVVLTTIQSWSQSNEGNDLNVALQPNVMTGVPEPWATVSTTSVSSTGFNLALEHAEVNDDDTAALGLEAPENVGYVAIESGVSVNLVTGSGTPVGLSTGVNNNVTSSCVNTDLPIPGAIAAANLRGFAGLNTRTEADGGWLRRCGMADAGAGNARAVLRIDEDADFDAERTHGTESAGVAIFGGDFVTTPISLARLSVRTAGTQLALEFSSATEVGHLGYRIWGRSAADAAWQLLLPELILPEQAAGIANGADSLTGRKYQLSVPRLGANEIRLEDVDILGRSRFHAAVQVDSAVGAEVSPQALDWAGIRASNAARTVRAASGSNRALAEVILDGVQRVEFEALAAFGFSAVPSDQLAVSDQGQAVPRFVKCPNASQSFGPGCSVEWFGFARKSLYGHSNSYLISVDPKRVLRVGSGALVEQASALGVFTEDLIQAPNQAYSFSAPRNARNDTESDPWYDARISASVQPVEVQRSFTLIDRMPGAVTLSVDLWGGLDFDGNAADHSVTLKLNGSELRRLRFDGLVAEKVTLTVPEALLQPSNTLSIIVNADTGYAADVVLLDGFSVRYPRATRVREGSLQLGDFAATVVGDSLFAGSFETRIGVSLEGASQPSVLWTQAQNLLRRDELNANSALDVKVQALALVNSSTVLRPQVHAAIEAARTGEAVDYLIVSHPQFESDLAPLIALQTARGLRVEVLNTQQIYARYSDFAPDPNAIAAAIAQRRPRFVLLVGGDSVDYHDYLNLGSQSFIPTFYRQHDPIVRFAPTDMSYSDFNADGIPDAAIGRLPVRTNLELSRAIAAIVKRGSAPAQRFVALSGASNNATGQFATESRTLLSYLRGDQQRDYGLIDEIGLSAARSKARDGLAGAADWLNYFGHSSPNRWGFENLLDTTQLANIQRSGLPAIVSQWGCWNNYFVAPNQDTMAHALMLRSNSLASTVIGSSSLAEASSHMALGTRFFDLLEDGRLGASSEPSVNTIGEVMLSAKQDLLRRAPEHAAAADSIMLFGDPAMPVR